MSVQSYVVAGCRPWNRAVFDEKIAALPGRWVFVGAREELTAERLAALEPRFVFLPHWSWKVPEEIVRRYECVGFHMTDLPYGRGGSPLQNLIARGHTTTRLSALRLDAGLDSGPVYLKRELGLDGTAEEIYVRCTGLSAEMIAEIVARRPEPRPQQGEPVIFRRRRPEQSAIPELADAARLFDFIRMLDAPAYPHAFLEHRGFRFEFRKARLDGEALTAEVRITITGSSPCAAEMRAPELATRET